MLPFSVSSLSPVVCVGPDKVYGDPRAETDENHVGGDLDDVHASISCMPFQAALSHIRFLLPARLNFNRHEETCPQPGSTAVEPLGGFGGFASFLSFTTSDPIAAFHAHPTGQGVHDIVVSVEFGGNAFRSSAATWKMVDRGVLVRANSSANSNDNHPQHVAGLAATFRANVSSLLLSQAIAETLHLPPPLLRLIADYVPYHGDEVANKDWPFANRPLVRTLTSWSPTTLLPVKNGTDKVVFRVFSIGQLDLRYCPAKLERVYVSDTAMLRILSTCWTTPE